MQSINYDNLELFRVFLSECGRDSFDFDQSISNLMIYHYQNPSVLPQFFQIKSNYHNNTTLMVCFYKAFPILKKNTLLVDCVEQGIIGGH